ncbi:hypothetical protein ACFL9U_13855 [Thermodesulfobacteriota bacterium]
MTERELFAVVIKIFGLFLVITGLISLLNDLVCMAGFICLGNQEIKACSPFYIGSFFSTIIRILGGMLFIKKADLFVNLIVGKDKNA